jgi:hypothetical protein
MPTNVTLLLKGSLVLFAKEGQQMGSVRILKDPPPKHVLSIGFQKQPPGGTWEPELPIPVSPINNDLRVTIYNSINPNITLRKKDVNIGDRMDTSIAPDSFKWFVDLENSELYGSSIGVKGNKFEQVLTFNSGELFNDARRGDNPSYNPLLVQHGINQNYKPFGFVAIRFGINFSTNDRAVFTNGGGIVFDSAQYPAGTNFKIHLNHDATEHPMLVTDANHYYKAVGAGIPPEEKKLFASIKQNAVFNDLLRASDRVGDEQLRALLERLSEKPPAGPEAACFPAYMSRTDPQ